jgi:hypothetical protein
VSSTLLGELDIDVQNDIILKEFPQNEWYNELGRV